MLHHMPSQWHRYARHGLRLAQGLGLAACPQRGQQSPSLPLNRLRHAVAVHRMCSLEIRAGFI